MIQTTTPPDGKLRAHKPGSPRSKPPGHFYDVCRWLWLGVFGFTMRVRSTGLKTVGKHGGMLIAVSHVSYLDPIVVSAVLRRRISWVSRIEYHRQWFMRNVLYHGGAFQVNRKGPALPTIREGLRRLERGEAVGIFPEGEMMTGANSVLRGAGIKHGVCLLAARSGRPVLPVIVLGTDQLNQFGPWMPAKRGRLWIHVGEPMHANTDGNSRQGRADFAERLIAEYVRLYAEMRVKFDLPESIAP
ncbi:MAG: lysophospholipid acyltransferase family protein [Verrucomicrobiota bacterium]